MDKLKQIYLTKTEKFSEDLKNIKRKNYWISATRLILFLSAISLSVIFGSYGLKTIVLINLTAIIPFLILVKLNVKYQNKIALLKQLITINEKEIEALKGNFSVFPAGNEYVNYEHPYTYDLDIFGNASIYQAMNRTCTKGGADKLAGFLQNPLLDNQQILLRQEAVKELSEKLDWRQNFQANGNSVLETGENENTASWFSIKSNAFKSDKKFHGELIDWMNSGFYFSKIRLLPFLLWALPLIALTALILTILGILPFMGLVLIVLMMFGVVVFFNKEIVKIHGQIGKKVNILNKYEKLLILIEQADFNSKYLQTLLKQTRTSDKPASEAIRHLKNLAKALDNRLNFVFIFFADGFLLWDLQVVLRLEKWRQKNQAFLPQWFACIYELDALSSQAAFAFNHPEFTFPELKQGDFYLKLKQGGHPLLDSKIRVDNDFMIDGNGQIRIITGANMAGKSTFLRTIGVNMILAMTGSVVCAQKMEFMPTLLHTSVRTNDSLQKHESYFYAELKRLKAIIERLEKGEKLFVIIDEMLRGTNSKDKHLGSAALIERLIKLQASGLVATHDIELGKMTEKYPENIENYRFEVDIKNNELFFDYQIKTGISQNLNAMFLMKKMGIVE